MALGSCTQWNPCNNPLADLIEKQDELADLQSLARRSDANSNKSSTLSKASTPSFFLSTEDFFTKYMKIFVKLIQAQNRKQAKPQKQPLKARSPKTYSWKSYIDCHHFCQQCDNYFKTFSVIGMNYTPFAASFFRSTINLR